MRRTSFAPWAVALVLLLPLLAACGGGRKAAETPGETTVLYTCDGDRQFLATFRVGEQGALVKLDGKDYLLAQVPTASGVRFTNGRIELWAKGDGGFMTGTPAGDYMNCRGVNQ